MTKSKKQIAIIMVLTILLALFGSLFAFFGSQKPNMVVEAATEAELKARAPGLYPTGSLTPTKTWDELIKTGGGITITTSGTESSLRASNYLEGDLVCGKVSGLTSLNRAFDYCHGLTSITFTENFDTSNVTDMISMFNGCSSLTTLDVSNFDTSKVTDMNCMFYYCTQLTTLDLSSFNTSNVIDMHSMFSDCSSLTSLDVSNFDTSKVIVMGNMFWGCSSLTALDVSNFNTSNVTDMNRMFQECPSLTTLDVSGFNTSNVKNMCSMFDGCSSLTALDVSNFNTSNVTDMCIMFQECSSLISLDISNFDTSNITDMGSLFGNCSSLTSLDVSNFDTSNVKNMYAMFSGCSSLTTLDVSHLDTSNVTDMSGMFGGCSSLTVLDVSNFQTSKVTDMSAMFAGCSCKTLNLGGSFVIPSGCKTANMFANVESSCSTKFGLKKEQTEEVLKQDTPEKRLKKVCELLGISVDELKENEYNELVKYFIDYVINTILCPQVADGVTIALAPATGYYYSYNNGKTKVTELSAATNGKTLQLYKNEILDSQTGLFKNGVQIKTWAKLLSDGDITIADGALQVVNRELEGDLVCDNVSSLTSLVGAFMGCTKLTSLDLSRLNTSKVTNMSSMFAGCSFKTLNLSGSFVIPSGCEVEAMFCSPELALGDDSGEYNAILNEPTAEARLKKLMGEENVIELEENDKDAYLMYISLFTDSTICEIILPTTVGVDVTLAPATGMFYAYTASDGDAQTTLPASSDGKTKLTLYKKVGETAEPVPFPSGQDTPSTGVVADISIVVIALVSTIGLIVIATKKKRIAR